MAPEKQVMAYSVVVLAIPRSPYEGMHWMGYSFIIGDPRIYQENPLESTVAHPPLPSQYLQHLLPAGPLPISRDSLSRVPMCT